MWYGVRKLRRASGIPAMGGGMSNKLGVRGQQGQKAWMGLRRRLRRSRGETEAPIAHAVSAKQSGCNDNKLNPLSV